MPDCIPRPWMLVPLVLVGAVLACARTEVPIEPGTPVVATPIPLDMTEPSPTAVPPTPTPTVPTSTPTPGEPTEVPTSVIAPTATPTVPTSTPTETQPSPTPTTPPTATPIPPTATTTSLPPPPTSPSGGSQPLPIPGSARFTQQFTVLSQGGTLLGRPQDMHDRRTETWASLRGGDAAWVFDLGSRQNVSGVRVWAHPDFNQPTTLRSIQVSLDGDTWTTVYTPAGECGVPNCESLPQREFVDRGIAPTSVQYVRLAGGPTHFAFAEVQIAVLP